MSLHLELGDVVRIISPDDKTLNNIIFLITYIDDTLMSVKNLDNEINLSINNGMLTNQSIESIELLSRSEEKGYSKQNGLIPGVWINIKFNNDVPIIITGKIVNTEEDMIEIVTWPDKETLYFDFEYKGPIKNVDFEIRSIPEDYAEITKPPVDVTDDISEPEPIESVEDKEQKDEAVEQKDEAVEQKDETIEPIVPDEEYLDDDDDIIEDDTQQPERDLLVKEKIKEVIFDADSIEFGEDLGSITQMIDVSEEEKRYGIDIQTNDMLDDFLSNIPTSKRTQKIINNIHTTIERYIQLRKMFSSFDQQDNPNSFILKGASHKPLKEYLKTFNNDLRWISPVVKNIKKVYDIVDEAEDVNFLTMYDSLSRENIVLDDRTRYSDQHNNYETLYNNLKEFYTPFNKPSTLSSLSNIEVSGIINAVINNIDLLNSSVAKTYGSEPNDGGVIKQKYMNSVNYVNGLNKIIITDKQGNNIITKVKQMTPSDNLSIVGLLMKPQEQINDSKIFLPQTNILQKTSIHSTLYKEKYNEETDDYTATIDTLSKPLQYNEFGKNNKLLLLDENLYGQDDIYNRFLDHIVPRIKELFLLVKKNISYPVSLHSVVKSLEPYLVYHNDLTYNNYDEMYSFVNEKIKSFKQNFVANKIQFNKYSGFKNYIFEKYSLPIQLEDYPNIVEYYNILENDLFSTILSKAAIDGMRCLTTIICSNARFLYSNINIDERIASELEQREKGTLESKDEDTTSLCDKYIISKKYNTIEELENDNDKEILFDKQYDNTRYDILDELPRNEMNTAEYIRFIADNLKESVGLDESNAFRDAESMVLGKRIVKDGDIAILNNPDKILYYKRENEKWIFDEDLTSRITSDSSNDMCNLQDSCIYVKKKCRDANNLVEKQNDEELRIIIDNINREVEIDAEQIIANIEKELSVYENNLYNKNKINNYLNSDYYKVNIGSSLVEDPIPSSPHTKLLYKILSQEDFVSKQMNIRKFHQNYTTDDPTNPFMYLCKDSRIPILPSFLVKLAEAFTEGNYLEVMESICKEQGELSDDGDKWVDKHSGFTIKHTEFNTDEGYDTSGYKAVSRDILEKEFSLDIISEEKKEYDNPVSQSIYNIIVSLTGFIGISISASHEFIINQVTIVMKDFISTPENYQRKIDKAEAKGKKIPSYDFTYQNLLLLITISLTFISIQCQIPSIKTNKTFPNCVRSFSGFPLTNTDTDLSGITYMACISHKIKSKTRPWNTIVRMSEQGLVKKLVTICKHIIKKPDIKNIIKDKQIYTKTLKEEEIKTELVSLEKWTSFLPPLIPVNVAPVKRITQDYFNDIETNNLKNTDLINYLFYKNYYLSLSIQKTIQLILNKEDLLLKTNSNTNFLENACCDSLKYNTLNYFKNRESSINEHNELSKKYLNKYKEYVSFNRPTIYLNSDDTKNVYPELTNTFSEATIYNTFLHYCKFNTGIRINDDLMSVCKKNNSAFNLLDPLDKKINTMKSEGLNYTINELYQLLLVVNKSNLVKTDINIEIPSIKEKFDSLLEYFRHSPNIDTELVEKLKDMYSVYGSYSDNKDTVDKAYNYIVTQNEIFEKEILMFLEMNGKNTKEINSVKSFLENLHTIQEIDSSNVSISEDNTTLDIISFIKNAVKHFFNDNISIIKHKMNYNKCYVPKYWKLSQRHVKDIQDFVNKSYSKLKQFYNNSELNDYLNEFTEKINPIITLMDSTPFDFSSSNEHKDLSIFNYDLIRQLYKYYLLVTFKKLIPVEEAEEIEIKDPISEEEQTKEEDEEEDLGGPAIVTLTTEMIEEEDTKTITQLDIVRSQSKTINTTISDLIITFVSILQSTLDALDMNKKTIMEKVLYSKEKEKEHITTYLKDMSNEEREVEDIFKNNKLGKWSKGITKGVVEYVGDVYDNELEEMEKYARMERKANKEGISNDNMSIYMMELENNMLNEQEIEDEVNDISGLGDDDDFGDNDGDEYF